MVITPSTTALPVYTSNLPTELVRSDARLQERVPETKATTESVNLKPSADEAQQSQRSDRQGDVRAETQADKTIEERGEQSNKDSSEQQKREQNREDREVQLEVEALKARDREVKAHEAAHTSVGGQYAGIASFSYTTGPDGKRYASGGEVPIDTSSVPGDPQATIDKLRVVQRAARAPVDPSSQDQRVAAAAGAKIAEAQAELVQQQRSEQVEEAKQAKESRESDEARQAEREEQLQQFRANRTRLQNRLSSLGVTDQQPPGTLLNVSA